jgi:preprotein translocase subunit SecF
MRLHIIKQQRIWWGISLGAVLLSLGAMALSCQQFGAPIRPGLDFVGGTRLQVALACAQTESCTAEAAIDEAQVQDILQRQGIDGATVQVVENYTVSIRTKTLSPEARTQIQAALNAEVGEFDARTLQIDTVGPSIGAELLEAGIKALMVSFFGIIVYLSFRFQFDYAVFAILALFHDALIASGVFAVLGLTVGNEIDSLFLVALLTIIGFSVNDTVVIYDRIRENRKQLDGQIPVTEIVEDSVNQTLARSINTSITTTLPLIAIFLFGGETLKFFALALIVGFVAGSYSSIFVASSLLAWWWQRQAKNLSPVLEQPVSDEVS